MYVLPTATPNLQANANFPPICPEWWQWGVTGWVMSAAVGVRGYNRVMRRQQSVVPARAIAVAAGYCWMEGEGDKLRRAAIQLCPPYTHHCWLSGGGGGGECA